MHKQPLIPLPAHPATAAHLRRQYETNRAKAYRSAGVALLVFAALLLLIGCRAAQPATEETAHARTAAQQHP